MVRQSRATGAIEIPIEQIVLESPLHRADWPRRTEIVPNFAERVARVRETGRWPGQPLRVRAKGDQFVLVSGFSRLAIATDAGLRTVLAVVEPETTELPLSEIHLRPWQEKARLNPKKLAERSEQARRAGTLPVPLVVRPAQGEEPAGYTLLDGLYWYRIACAMRLEHVPAIVRAAGKTPRAPTDAG